MFHDLDAHAAQNLLFASLLGILKTESTVRDILVQKSLTGEVEKLSHLTSDVRGAMSTRNRFLYATLSPVAVQNAMVFEALSPVMQQLVDAVPRYLNVLVLHAKDHRDNKNRQSEVDAVKAAMFTLAASREQARSVLHFVSTQAQLQDDPIVQAFTATAYKGNMTVSAAVKTVRTESRRLH